MLTMTSLRAPGSDPPSEESEVEVLSPYEYGSLRPRRMMPVSTRVKRTRKMWRIEELRAVGIVAGGFLVVMLGLATGILAVLATGMRTL